MSLRPLNLRPARSAKSLALVAVLTVLAQGPLKVENYGGRPTGTQSPSPQELEKSLTGGMSPEEARKALEELKKQAEEIQKMQKEKQKFLDELERQ